MENPQPVGKDTTVAVAVKKGKNGQAALKWTIENLVNEGHMVTLVHVRNKAPVFNRKDERKSFSIEAVAGRDVQRALDTGYSDIVNMRAREMIQPFQSYCKRKNMESEVVILEDDSIASALADFALLKNIDVLVMGAASSKNLVKTLLSQEVASKVVKRIPYFCTLYGVARGKLHFVKSESSIPQSVPENDADFVEGIDSASCLTYCGSSVNSNTRLLQSDTCKDFEFRSPLKDYGVSDFSVGGFTSSDSDISFVSSDASDCTPCSWLTHSSGWSSNLSSSHFSLSANNSDLDNLSSRSSRPLLLRNPGMVRKMDMLDGVSIARLEKVEDEFRGWK